MGDKSINNRPSVQVVKDIYTSPEQVFDAWLDPEMIGRWMFGSNIRDEEIIKLETDPTKGGTFSFVVRRDGQKLNHLGRYLELDRPRRLAFTWGIESESEDESVVRIEIVPTGSGCRLTLVHELDPKWEEYADRTREAWSLMLDRLIEIV